MSVKMYLIVLVVLIAVFLITVWCWDFSSPNRPMTFGVTFSVPQAEYLGLDWRAVYIDMLDNLKIRQIRLIAYWNQLEKKEGRFDFTDLDWQVSEAQKRGAKVVLSIGRKLPHWPECHIPDWAGALSEKENQNKIMDMLKSVVEHYKTFENVVMWQVENEPLVGWFGHCPLPDPDFTKREIALVRRLDSRHVLITDSGELSLWRESAHLGDVFGTTLYRVVWNDRFGYFSYDWFFPSIFYHLKAQLNGLDPAQVIVAELQAEAWLRDDINRVSLEEQRKSINAKQLRHNIDIARRTGFKEAYLWGVEYWYWLKDKQNDPSLYNEAKKLF